ncbi:MAG: hypothetical protein AAFR21_15795 [Pseudomonadota bacterium]
MDDIEQMERTGGRFSDIATGFLGTLFGAAGNLANTAASSFGERLSNRLVPNESPNSNLPVGARTNEARALAQPTSGGITLTNDQLLIAGGVAAAAIGVVLILGRN